MGAEIYEVKLKINYFTGEATVHNSNVSELLWGDIPRLCLTHSSEARSFKLENKKDAHMQMTNRNQLKDNQM